MYSRLFADISSNNQPPDFAAYSANGHIFVSIKATEGIGYVNPLHKAWSYAAGAHRVAIMHYHFARPDITGGYVSEADKFMYHVLPIAGKRDYLALDFERSTGHGTVGDAEWVRGFYDHVRKRSRFKCVLYADRSTLQALGGSWRLPRLRVWEADWSEAKDFAPRGCTVFSRQLSDGVVGPLPHSLPGIGQCDVNRMTYSTFAKVSARRLT